MQLAPILPPLNQARGKQASSSPSHELTPTKTQPSNGDENEDGCRVIRQLVQKVPQDQAQTNPGRP